MQFVRLIDPDNMPDAGYAAEFWRGVTGEDETPDDTFVEGFASGAADIWEEVKDQV